MIESFQNFRKKWEEYAKNQNWEFLLVSDNCVYDGGFINDLIFKHLPDGMPIPYSASTNEYNPFLETHSQQKGLLYSVDPDYKSNWGLSKRIEELYDNDVSPEEFHDHNPANDAYTIAFDQQVLLGIQAGRITKRT